MRKSRTVVLSALMGIVAVASFAAPAVAANPRLAFVNGIPGKSVDVCVGDSEVKSGLRYGRWFDRTLAPGERTVRFRAASAGTCKGRTLARKTFDLEANVDATIVVTARSPKVVSFNNKLTPAPVGNTNWLAFRHAGDMGSVVASITQGEVIQPSAVQTFDKSEQWRVGFGGSSSFPLTFAVFKPSKFTPFLGPAQVLMVGPRRHEIILVGTTPSNARLVAVVRPTIAA
jgi:hypothetical protein